MHTLSPFDPEFDAVCREALHRANYNLSEFNRIREAIRRAEYLIHLQPEAVDVLMQPTV